MSQVGAGETMAREMPGAVTLRAWLSLGILLPLIVLSSIDETIIGLIVDPIKADLGITDLQFSLLVGLAFALFYGLASVPMGWLADRFSRHIVVFCGVTLWSLATAACALAGSSGNCSPSACSSARGRRRWHRHPMPC